MKKIFYTFAVLMATTMSGFAFPSWMGVYGDFEHHDGGNPGTFTILLNQDYVGLQAEVGIQVDGGNWYTIQMHYAGHIDGNSIWEVTPDSEFPAGSTVKYYFHGYDNWGGNIWDNNGGSDYTFTALDPYAYFLPAQQVEGLNKTASDGEFIYSVDNAPIWDPDLLIGTVSTEGVSWVRHATTSLRDVREIAANSSGAIAIKGLGGNGTYITKIDHAVTQGAPLTETSMVIPAPASNSVASSKIAALDNGEFVVMMQTQQGSPGHNGPYDVYCSFSSNQGTTWSTPQYVDSIDSGTLHSVGAGSSGVYAIYNRPISGGGFQSDMLAARWDGSVWSIKTMYQAAPWAVHSVKSVVTDHGLLVVNPEDTSSIVRWKSTSSPINRSLPYPMDVELIGEGINQDVFLLVDDGDASSLDIITTGALGSPWYEEGTVTRPVGHNGCGEMIGQVEEIQSTTGRVHLQWALRNGCSGGSTLWQASNIIEYPELHWVGNVWNWPLQGNVSSTDDVWVNIESWPKHAAKEATVYYMLNGVQNVRYFRHMTVEEYENNDHWYINIGDFPSGTQIEYYIKVEDHDGKTLWDANGGANYHITVN